MKYKDQALSKLMMEHLNKKLETKVMAIIADELIELNKNAKDLIQLNHSYCKKCIDAGIINDIERCPNGYLHLDVVV